MKICHVIYIPRFSGAEILVRNLAIQHRAEGHEIAIVAIMPAEDSFVSVQQDLESMGVMLLFPNQLLNKWERLQFLVQALKQFSPDVVFAHAVIPSFYARYAIALARLRGTSVVSVLHDASQDDYASPYFRFVEKWLAPPPAAIVTVSPQSAENYCQRIRSSIDTQVIPNGVQLEPFAAEHKNRSKTRSEIFKANGNELIFLQVGRISLTKQQHYSLQAFAAAVKTFNLSGKLCFVGITEDRAYETELKTMAKSLEIAEHVLFLGARPDIPELLAAADLYLMPSQFEAHSVAFIEALASGITIIASDIASFQFGSKFAGVTLISPQMIDEFVAAIEQAIQTGSHRWQRDLSDYSIDKTANSYLALSKSVASVELL
jgi:L-malate glycosyltransferase